MARVGGKKSAQEAGLYEDQTAFPRGGAALLSHQERKQIEQQALAAVEAETEGLHGQGHDGITAQKTPTGQELSKKRKHSVKAAQVSLGQNKCFGAFCKQGMLSVFTIPSVASVQYAALTHVHVLQLVKYITFSSFS